MNEIDNISSSCFLFVTDFFTFFLISLTASCYYFVINPETRLMVALETGGCVLFTCIPREPLPSCTHTHCAHTGFTA